MKRLLISLPVMALLASGCQDPDKKPPDSPPDNPSENPQPLPSELSVQWQPIDNSVGSWKFFRSEFTLENKGPQALGSSGWKLYFSFVRRLLDEGEGDETGIQKLEAQGVKISKGDAAKSGDYYVIEPLASFKPLAPGEKRTISVLFQDWAILKTDAPSGFHITFSGDTFDPAVAFAVPSTVKIDASDPKQTMRFEGDVMPVQTPALRYNENPSRQTLELAGRLLPSPRRIEAGAGQVTLSSGIVIGYTPALRNEATYLTSALVDVLSGAISSRLATGGEQISLSIDSSLDIDGNGSPDAEGYVLDVKDGKVSIKGADAAGVFYGIQTLRQLVPVEAYAAAVNPANRRTELSLPAVQIADAPGFTYRGMHLDVGRHFQSKETVKKLLDVLAHYKINKFHFHLTDDEGWRLEIPGIPELTSYGARRGFDPSESEMLHAGLGSGNDLAAEDHISRKPASQLLANLNTKPAYQGFETATLNFVGKGSGYYTTRDFEEILAYATERHIDVIPEIDVPGHARAAVRAMEYRYRKFKDSDPTKAAQYRLVDPADTSKHTSVQGYTDNFINPCLETSYAFLSKVTQEVKARYAAVPGARLTAIHGGGDELPSLSANVWWQGSPLCKQNPETKDLDDTQLANHFFTRWNKIIATTASVPMTGWDDIIHHGLDLENFIPMPWSNVWGWGREDDAYKFANQGYKVILSHATNLYMDLAHNKDPDEPGYYWANFVDVKKTFEYRPFDIYANATQDRMGNALDPSLWKDKERLSDAGRRNILGMHGLLWSENVKTPEVLEYMAFPKMLGVAERAWNPELPPVSEMPALWARFTNSLGQYVLPRLDAYRPVDLHGELPAGVGVNYRIPLPGAQRIDGKLQANVLFPGLGIEYSTDGGATWKAYSEPTSVSGKVLLRARATDGRTSRTTEIN
ncbi:family 20 glycosylhydrolase [Vitiosangium sp. GDMCC 1.1324]|uniref:family 20 glycosylhydrolase n=1 Tax=Vitiosangium sp. (strain GDMCC 1.1324) TaxID=2138576 RepID=UPI000D3705EA|nr:family 20 glycosylhydrolase [Vitiosangium sp. GDMCC 1.1324]PTL76361.1 beta-hexosaminidase [Vitiosangium sp. GDMCC 1.1324]